MKTSNSRSRYLSVLIPALGMLLLTGCPFSTETAVEDSTPPEVRFAIKYAGEAEYEFIGGTDHETRNREFDLACVAAHGRGITNIDLRMVEHEKEGDAPLIGGCNAVYQLPTLLGLERGSNPVDMGDTSKEPFFGGSLYMFESAPGTKESNYKAHRSPVFASAMVRYSPEDCESNIWDALGDGTILEKPLLEQISEVRVTRAHCRAFAWAQGISTSKSMTLYLPTE